MSGDCQAGDLFERDDKAIDNIKRWRARMVCSECGDGGIIACVSEEERICWCSECGGITTQLSKEKWIGKEVKKQ